MYRGVVPTDEKGRVVGREGMYATGWVRRGPSGVISTNKGDAEQVVYTMIEDWEAGISARSTEGGGDNAEDLVSWLRAKKGGSGAAPIVCDYDGWHRIDTAERAAARPDAPREKLVDPEQLLCTALSDV
jgi:ferredoxin--NADP+ reductase